jgi:hypothetical protein
MGDLRYYWQGDVDGVPHYRVQWSATLVPKYEMGMARVLVARFEARLRAQGRQNGGNARGRLPPLRAGKKAIAGARGTGETHQKMGGVDLGSRCEVGYCEDQSTFIVSLHWFHYLQKPMRHIYIRTLLRLLLVCD